MNLTLEELERVAFIRGDTPTLEVLHAREEDACGDYPFTQEYDRLLEQIKCAEDELDDANDERDAAVNFLDAVADRLKASNGLTPEAAHELGMVLSKIADNLPSSKRERAAACEAIEGKAGA